MSGKIMGAVWDLELPHNERIVLLAMADHADHEGNNVYPSMSLIAWKTGYSERTVRRIVKKLVKAELLVVVAALSGQTKKYRIQLSAGVQKTPYQEWKKQQQNDPDNGGGHNVTPDIAVSPHPGHSYVTPTPDIAVSPKPSVKPSIEPSAPLARPALSADEFDALRQAIQKHCNLHNGREMNILHMLRGTSKKKGYKEYAAYFVERPVSADEFVGMMQHYKKTHPDLDPLQSPETIADWMGKFRQLQDNKPAPIVIIAQETAPLIPDGWALGDNTGENA